MNRSTPAPRFCVAFCAVSAAAFFAANAFVQPAMANAPDDQISDAHNGLTISGAVGLPLNPTADIPNKGGVRIQADYFDLGDIKLENNFGEGFSRNQKLGDAQFVGIHAAGALSRRWEISGGVDYLRTRGIRNQGDFNDTLSFGPIDGLGFSVGAKYQVWHSDTCGSAIAVGAGYSSSLFRNANVYVVGTRPFDVGQRAINTHLGVRYDRFSIKGQDDYDGGTYHFDQSSSKVSIFAGAEVPIDRSGRFSLVGEIGTKNAGDFDLGDFDVDGGASRLRTKFPYSASVRYARNGLAASLGIMRQGVTGDSGLFGQVGKTF